MSGLLEYQLRIRSADNSTDAITITSVRGGTNPYLSTEPSGDGASFDPLTMDSVIGVYTGRIADWDIGSMQRIVTSHLEDAGGAQQLGYRHAILERRIDGGSWGVLTNGVLTLLRLVSGIEWEYQITDATQAQIVAQLFGPDSTTTITDFFAAWPNRGCLFGGPIMTPFDLSGKRGSVLGITDLGGWLMRVETASTDQYFLRPVTVYGPTDLWQSKSHISAALATAINQSAAALQAPFRDSAADPWTTIADAETNYWSWPGLVILVNGVPFKPIDYNEQQLIVTGDLLTAPLGLSSPGLRIQTDGVRTLTNGDLVLVRGVTVLPTEVCPLYLEGNPIDLLTQFWTAAGIAFNASACAALKADPSIGAAVTIAFRITGPEQLSSIVAEICRPFGIGLRVNGAGEIEPFQGRAIGATMPTRTIDPTSVLLGSTTLPFEYDPTKAVHALTYHQAHFAPTISTLSLGVKGVSAILPTDQVNVSEDVLTFVASDPGAPAIGSIEIQTAGMVSPRAGGIQSFAQPFAKTVFDRFGRGEVALETTFLRGADVGGGATTDGIKLGDELLVALPELPNANYRIGDNDAIGARAMQVVRLTEIAAGYQVRLVDSGPTNAPIATVPTLTITTSGDAPRSVAIVTITNAATLNAAPFGARMQMAVTSGSTPLASDYSDVLAWAAGAIPTGAIRLPAATAGMTVWARARSESPTARPSSYGTAHSVALTAINAPTSLTATPSTTDASVCVLAWTPGSGTPADLVDVFLRHSGDAFSAAVRIDTIDAQSIAYTLVGLAAATAYIATVQTRDRGTGDVSAITDVSFTTGSALRTLAAPLFPTAFAAQRGDNGLAFGDRNFILSGTFGLAVLAQDVPGFIEVSIAVETSPGAGTFGAFAVALTTPAIVGSQTIATFNAPNDGLKRRLRARAVADGAIPSDYTASVDVLPWTIVPLVDPSSAEDVSKSFEEFTWVDSSDNLTRTFSWVRGTFVDRVLVYSRSVESPIVDDPWDFSDVGPAAILAVGTDSFTVTKPPANSAISLYMRFEPHASDGSVGNSRPVIVTAGPRVVIDVVTSTAEAAGVGTVTAVVADPGALLNAAAVDGAAVGAISWHVTVLGVTTVAPSDTAPVGTSGTYTKNVTLDPLHNVQLVALAHFLDGSTQTLGSWTFDSNKISDVVTAAASYVGSTGVATATVNFDTDTQIGASCAQYRIDGGSWIPLTVSSALIAQWTIAQTGSTQTIDVQGKNAIDGTFNGHIATFQVDAYSADGPSISAVCTLTDTTFSIAWSGAGVITVSIDGGTPGTPSASPITGSRDTHDHTYSFLATRAGQSTPANVTVPNARPTTGTLGLFTAFSHSLQDATLNTIRILATFTGTVTGYVLLTNDIGFTGDPTGNTWAVAGSPSSFPYDYTAGEDLVTGISGTGGTRSIGFQLQAIDSMTLVGTSTQVFENYGWDL